MIISKGKWKLELKKEILDLSEKPRMRIKKLGGPHGKNSHGGKCPAH